MVDERTFINETGFSPGVSATYTVDGTELLEVYLAGVEHGRREALLSAADALIPAPPVEISASAALIIEWLRARAAKTPGGGACVLIYTPGEVEDEENACVTHEGPWPCETPGGAA